ncbi:MAG: hypothetical protein VR66_06540 [Peptococcaceae bacterium BRH_c23]|nr:MAG: hypothetical protein VR66_06540 [Peptococcaceae bacterium BRH_c23]KJS81962.1 MAG: hypothetical protein JL57_25495 [Desulfosporosinus sp. BICA1-9]HBW35746.1 hypothetical protein [Desulfosporosinus sp.]
MPFLAQYKLGVRVSLVACGSLVCGSLVCGSLVAGLKYSLFPKVHILQRNLAFAKTTGDSELVKLNLNLETLVA